MKERPDSVIAQLRYNQALAAWQGEMLPEALKAFDQALSMGNNDPQAYEYAYSVAYQAQDTEHMNKFSHEGFKRFGDSDPKFLQWAVNGYIDNKDFDTAAAMLEDAIAKNPDNPFYYSSYGVLNESLGKMDEAEKNYAKAIELDPNVAQVQMNMGRILAEKYDALDEAAGNLSQAEYGKYNAETLIPLLKESAKYFEAAYALDNENTMPLKYLKNIYYRLDDGANLKRVEDLLKY